MLDFLKQHRHTHMPYIFYEDGEPRMLFTVLQNSFWKLYYSDFKNTYKINTPLQKIIGHKNFHMCQPACYKQGDIYKISFCIQSNRIISLYYCQTKDILQLDNLVLVIKDIYGGCMSPNYIMINNKTNTIGIYKHPQKIESYNHINELTPIALYDCTAKYLARISYVYNNDNQIIVSYADPILVDQYGSFYLNINDPNSIRYITDLNNKPLYKASIDPITQTIYYGKKIGVGFEERTIEKISLNNIKSVSTNKLNKYY